MRKASSSPLAVFSFSLLVLIGCIKPQQGLDETTGETAPATLRSSKSPLAPPGDASYVGADACRKCHVEQYESWQNSAHNRSLEILVDTGKQHRPECLRCHTTGFGEASGFVDADSTPLMAAVTCEACHGPGSRHVEAQERNLGDEPEYGNVNCAECQHTRICILCHRDPHFDAKAAARIHRNR